MRAFSAGGGFIAGLMTACALILHRIAYGHAALRLDRVRARGEHLGDAGGLQPLLGHAEGGAQARAAGAHHDHVVIMRMNIVCCHDALRSRR